jgi:hypothetical protein
MHSAFALVILHFSTLFTATTVCSQREALPFYPHFVSKGPTIFYFPHADHEMDTSSGSITRVYRVRASSCIRLRGGSQSNANTWPDQQQGSDNVQVSFQRDRDSDMLVQEPSPPIQSSSSNKFSDPKLNERQPDRRPSELTSEMGMPPGVIDQTVDALPPFRDARSRRDQELEQLFRSGFCKREDLDDRCMKFIYDVDPELAAEVHLEVSLLEPRFLSPRLQSSSKFLP